MTGFRTIIFNLVAMIAAWLATKYGIEIAEHHQMEITTCIIALGNIALRIITKTPVGKDKCESC